MKNNIYVISFILSLFIFAACDNEMQSDKMDNGDAISLNIIMGGIEDYQESTKTRGSDVMQEFVQPLDSTQNTGIDILTTVESTPVSEAIQTRANLNNNSRFRLVIFNAENGMKVADCQYQISGTTATLVSGAAPQLHPGNYKFVSFTKNTNVIVDTGDVVDIGFEEFATCCLTKNISATDRDVEIKFARQTSQISLDIKLEGFGNNPAFSYSNITCSPGYKGVWKINIDSNDEPISEKEMETGTLTTDDVWNYIPENSITEVPFSISLKNVSLNGINYPFITVSPKMADLRGHRNKITITLRGGIVLNDICWAPGNLYRHSDGTYNNENTGQSGFTGTWDGGYYWNWNILDHKNYSTSIKGAWVEANDPCSKVKPENTWKTPTQAQLETLRNSPNHWGFLDGKSGRFFGPNDELFLPAAGWRPKTASLTNVGIGGLYWSSTTKNTASGSATFLGIQENAVNIDDSGHRAMGVSIRCVRR